jgi:hypothetical protein
MASEKRCDEKQPKQPGGSYSTTVTRPDQKPVPGGFSSVTPRA